MSDHSACVTRGGQQDRVASVSSPLFSLTHRLLIPEKNHPQITIWNFTPFFFFFFPDFLSSFVLFAVDIPGVLFVFIYDYLLKKRMAYDNVNVTSHRLVLAEGLGVPA